jgi:hypothetical protein
MTLLAWNAVSTKINARGQVEGTCVSVHDFLDPAFSYFLPTSLCGHGYDLCCWPGEMINS